MKKIILQIIISLIGIWLFWFVPFPFKIPYGWSYLWLGIILPLSCLLESFLIGKNIHNSWKLIYLCYPLFYAFLYMITGYFTISFQLSQNFKYIYPDIGLFAIGYMTSITGFLLGFTKSQK